MQTRETIPVSHVALLVVACSICVRTHGAAEAQLQPMRPGDGLLGEWWTEGREGRVRFVRHADGTYRGITTCCSLPQPTPEHPAIDVHNPNPKMRGRSTIGIVLIWNLTYADGRYSDGYVYNPRDGDTYRFKAEILDRNTLKIRGYMAIPLLGQSQIWKRYAAR